MIICKIQGGLGNQMFQYAYVRNLSNIYSEDFRLDIRVYDFVFGAKREFLLNKFSNMAPNTDINVSINGPMYKIDDDFNFKIIPKPVGCNYYLDGYWQSEKYFIESAELIRQDFKPSQDLLERIFSYKNIKSVLETNTISLHIRRGDYLTSNGYHPVQSIDYYNKSVEIIGGYDNILVFSDDIEWCKDNLQYENTFFIEGFTDIEDLYIMSMCKNNIIANSSFSWWGAWLNNNPSKKIIAPSNWFGESAKLNTSDIVPESWIKI